MHTLHFLTVSLPYYAAIVAAYVYQYIAVMFP